MKKIVTIIGARPQFIKASVVSRAIAARPDLQEIIIHTGQHFDANMSAIFFEQLAIPKPDYLLDIHSATHAEMTGRMMIEIEKILQHEKPDMVMVYGDTNSTLAGALTASKLHIPLCHVEAGLRSFNMQMPEEINRIVTDRLSNILFCPTDTAMENLHKEGFGQNHLSHIQMLQVGDVMQDSALLFAEVARPPENVKIPEQFMIATFHRAENTDDPVRLENIVTALNHIHETITPVIVPLHPRTQKFIAQNGLSLKAQIVEPLGYLEMIWLLQNCAMVLTDSGGMQKEAFFFRKPCVTMRDQTEWVELVQHGVNILAGAEKEKIIAAVNQLKDKHISDENNLYGGGQASEKIAATLAQS